MKNDFRGKTVDGKEVCISILPTLLVTAMSKVNINHTSTSGFKQAGDVIYMVGNNTSGLLGSEYLEEYDLINKKYLVIPPISLESNLKLYKTIYKAINQNLLASCHDISDGGMLISLVESMFENDLGAHLNISGLDNIDLINFLYNEGPGRFIVSVPEVYQGDFEKQFGNLTFLKLGQVTQNAKLRFENDNDVFINEDISTLASLWKKEF